ncbi:MAG: phosphatase PAP2 family protein [Pseudomonadota bacterium]
MVDTARLNTEFDAENIEPSMAMAHDASITADFQEGDVSATSPSPERSRVTESKLTWQSFRAALTANVGRAEFVVLALVCVLLIAAQSVLYYNNITSYLYLALTLNGKFLLTILALVVICDFTFLMVRYRPSSPLAFLSSHPAFRTLLSRVVPGVVIALCLALFMPTFSQVKSAIPILTDYTWDATFIAWDRTLHGADPWRIIQPVLGFPVVTAMMGHLYHVWFALIHLAPICIAMYVSDKHLKLRFFAGYFLIWSLAGMVSAVALASVGPVFLEPLIGDPYFAEQMAYLKSANAVITNPVIEVQQMLLEWYAAENYGIGRGITAMPSMHVALAALYAFAMWDLDKRLGVVFTVYLVLIMLGSVHLAYHYAVDGYVSLIMVGIIWFATKPLANAVLGRKADPVPQGDGNKNQSSPVT